MRWIFITLVFINLLLLAYFWQSKEQASEYVPAAVEIASKGKAIVLLSELKDPLVPTTSTQAQRQRSELCYTAGPFADHIDARHLLARAAALGFQGVINELQVKSEQPAEYWVYVPPRASREQALSTLRELQKRNYDSYIITQGDMSEGISLGLFRNKESAYGLQRKVRASGTEVEVKVINESVSEYWVEIKESAQLSEEMRQRIKANESDLSWEMVECR